jgi:hypothetical protein
MTDELYKMTEYKGIRVGLASARARAYARNAQAARGLWAGSGVGWDTRGRRGGWLDRSAHWLVRPLGPGDGPMGLSP